MDDVVYVYFHIDPKSREIVYIGHGTNERAWRCTSLKDNDGPIYGHRSKEHAKWCQQLIQEGFVPSDWVKIEERNMSKYAACLIEQELIRKYKPLFNKPLGQALKKVVGEKLKQAKAMREEGLAYSRIAENLKLSTMAIWRALNDRNKNG